MSEFEHLCDAAGCANEGQPCWLPDAGDEPSEYLCGDHAGRAGYCIGCGTFWGGVETFEFGPHAGWCDNCASEFETEDDADDDPVRAAWEYVM